MSQYLNTLGKTFHSSDACNQAAIRFEACVFNSCSPLEHWEELEKGFVDVPQYRQSGVAVCTTAELGVSQIRVKLGATKP